MKPLVAIGLFLACADPSVCSATWPHGGVLSPTHRVIATPSKTDFGFVGTWRHALPPPWSDGPDRHRGDRPPVVISMNDDGTYSYKDGDSDAVITCRAIALEKAGFALVEVEANLKAALPNGDPKCIRCLVVAKREADELFFQYLHSEDLGRLMAEEGYKVDVSPPGFVFSVVDADPAELLDCLSEHWSELCHGPTGTLINESREPIAGSDGG